MSQIETLYQGKYIRVVRSGRWEFVKRNNVCGIVGIVAVTDARELILVEQFRVPVDAHLIELPAGLAGDLAGAPVEDLAIAAKRELLEETGYVAREWAFGFTMYPTVAYSDEAIQIWFARGLEHRGAQLDEGEFLDVITATPEEFLGWCRDGKVVDSKTLASAIWIQNVLAGTWKLDWQP